MTSSQYICIYIYITLLKILAISMMLQRTHFPSFFSQNNLDIVLTYTTHNLNNKYPFITCSDIQEYLGYLSNNLYFLFSHSWPEIVYNFGQVQRTSQVERKTKCSKKTTVGYIAVLWTALLYNYQFTYVTCIIYVYMT